MAEAHGEVGIGEMLEVAPNLSQRAERGEAAVGVVAVELEMFGNQCVQKRMAAAVELALIEENAARAVLSCRRSRR